MNSIEHGHAQIAIINLRASEARLETCRRDVADAAHRALTTACEAGGEEAWLAMLDECTDARYAYRAALVDHAVLLIEAGRRLNVASPAADAVAAAVETYIEEAAAARSLAYTWA